MKSKHLELWPLLARDETSIIFKIFCPRAGLKKEFNDWTAVVLKPQSNVSQQQEHYDLYKLILPAGCLLLLHLYNI